MSEVRKPDVVTHLPNDTGQNGLHAGRASLATECRLFGVDTVNTLFSGDMEAVRVEERLGLLPNCSSW